MLRSTIALLFYLPASALAVASEVPRIRRLTLFCGVLLQAGLHPVTVSSSHAFSCRVIMLVENFVFGQNWISIERDKNIKLVQTATFQVVDVYVDLSCPICIYIYIYVYNMYVCNVM